MVNQRYYRGDESTVLFQKYNFTLKLSEIKGLIFNQRSRASQYAVNRWAAIEVEINSSLGYRLVFP